MAAHPYPTATVFGCTGLVGANILTTLLATPTLQTTAISRRAPKPAASTPPPSNLTTILEPDTTAWASKLTSQSPVPHTVYSGLGTTRAAAGGIDNQWKIDHDLNVELAKAAREAGVKTFVFVSSSGTRGPLISSLPYSRMKIGVEDAIKDLGFDNAVIVRPGAILGQREKSRGTAESIMQSTVNGLGSVSGALKDGIGQPAEEIARAAVAAGRIAAEGKAPEKYWVLEQADIVRLGRNEWKD